MSADPRVFHHAATTRLAACGQRLGPRHLGNSRAGLAQVAEQYPDLACARCVARAVTAPLLPGAALVVRESAA